jgi:hypothetical protein
LLVESVGLLRGALLTLAARKRPTVAPQRNANGSVAHLYRTRILQKVLRFFFKRELLMET